MFWGGGADEDERYARLGDRGEGQSDSGAGEILVKLSYKNFEIHPRMKSTIGHCIISHMLKKCCRERD